MLHTKFRYNQTTGTKKKRLLKGFTMYGHDGQLGHVTSIMSTNFHFFVPERFLTKFGSK